MFLNLTDKFRPFDIINRGRNQALTVSWAWVSQWTRQARLSCMARDPDPYQGLQVDQTNCLFVPFSFSLLVIFL